MNARRGFLAMIGSSVFSGAVLRSVGAVQPTLILPAPSSLPVARPLLNACRTQMDAFLEVGRHVPKDMFLDWLENGLQLAERHRRSPVDLVREEERIEAAVARHGSIIAAMRAGAI